MIHVDANGAAQASNIWTKQELPYLLYTLAMLTLRSIPSTGCKLLRRTSSSSSFKLYLTSFRLHSSKVLNTKPTKGTEWLLNFIFTTYQKFFYLRKHIWPCRRNDLLLFPCVTRFNLLLVFWSSWIQSALYLFELFYIFACLTAKIFYMKYLTWCLINLRWLHCDFSYKLNAQKCYDKFLLIIEPRRTLLSYSNSLWKVFFKWLKNDWRPCKS